MTPSTAYKAGLRTGPLAQAYVDHQRAYKRLRRHQAAILEGREPGRTGRPPKPRGPFRWPQNWKRRPLRDPMPIPIELFNQ